MRRKLGIGLVVLLVLLVGLVVVADRVGANVAEGKIADLAAQEMKKASVTSATPPEATISGFPFLTQVLGGNYRKITITADKPQNNTVKLDKLTLVATDVKAAMSDLLAGHGPVVATNLTGDATMSWESVKPLIELSGVPVPIDLAQVSITGTNDAIELKIPITIAGYSTTLVAKGLVKIDAGKVQLTLTDVGTSGTELPPAGKALLERYRDRLTATINVPQMPFKLVINQVSSDANGIHVLASAANAQLVS